MDFLYDAVLYRLLAGYDATGARSLSSPVSLKVNVVQCRSSVAPNSTQAQGTGNSSSGQDSWENTGAFKLLFPPNVTIGIGDKVVVWGQTLRVSSVMPRYTVPGQWHHTEVTGSPWL